MAGVDLTRINSNIAAMNTLNSLRDVNKNLGLHQARLASGKRINEAADDPAGLTLATKMGNRAQYLQQAVDNIGDGKNLLSVAEGGLKKINEIVTKMRVKAEQAASDTLGASERSAVSTQLGQYAKEIDDIVNQTTWNGNKLLDGLNSWASQGNKIVMQTGADANETTTLQASENFGSAAVSNILSTHIASSNGATYVAASFAAGGTGLAVGATPAATGALGTGMTELATGTYTVKLAVSGTNNVGTAQVFDAGGSVVKIDNGAGVLVDSISFDPTAAASIDTGRGFTIDTTAAATANGVASLKVNYQKAGDYAFDVSNATNASAVVTDLDSATAAISSRLQTVGALMDRFSFKEDALAISKVNTEAAFNRIMNADMAEEQLSAVKFQILQQTATTMLAQTNQAPQAIMQLFR